MHSSVDGTLILRTKSVWSKTDIILMHARGRMQDANKPFDLMTKHIDLDNFNSVPIDVGRNLTNVTSDQSTKHT